MFYNYCQNTEVRLIVSDYLLFAVFALFFSMESVILSGKGTVIIYSHLLKRWGFKVSNQLPFFGGKHLSLKTLLPPLGSAFITGSHPIIMSPDGIMLNPYEGRYNTSHKNSYRFSDIKNIGVSGVVLLINGENFCRMHSDIEARHWKDKVLSATGTTAEKRTLTIADIINQMFDIDCAEKIIYKIQTVVKPLRLTVNIYYLFLLLL